MDDVMSLMLPHIEKLNLYEGVDPPEVLAEKAGIDRKLVIKLNGNENPYGPSPNVVRELSNFGEYNVYPDPEQRMLREKLSMYLGIGSEYIVAGNGSDELIDMTLRMFVGPGDKIIDPSPTFGMYSICARICGGEVVSVPRDINFDVDVEAIRKCVDQSTKAIFLASPNNPTGNIATEEQIRELLTMGILVVVDETYFEFCGHTVLPLIHQYPNLMLLRSFSKWAGLAGLRIGLGVMNPELVNFMMKIKPPYNVNLAAEVALSASLDDSENLKIRIGEIVSERERIFEELVNIPGVIPWPSQANFILCQITGGNAKKVFESLARRGIFLRYFSNPRLVNFIRASVGLESENDALIDSLTDIMNDIQSK